MGVRTHVSRPSGRSHRPDRRMVRIGFDVVFVLTLFTLVVFGLLILYSASWDFSRAVTEEKNLYQIISRQILWLVVGGTVMMFCVYFNYRYWGKIALPVILGSIALLIIVLNFGEERLGAAGRTLSGGSIQPSELAKLATVIYVSVWLNAKREYLHRIWFGIVPLGVILGLVGGFILMQPDVSAVLTIISIGIMLFVLAGGRFKQLIVIGVLAVLVGSFVIMTTETGRTRIEVYLSGVNDPAGASYHVQRSLEAFAKGGWIGVGLGKADTKHTGLPVPPTDSIYAVVGEELGVAGATFVLGLYSVLLWRGLVIARNAPDMLGSLLAGGLTLWVCLEAFINMSVILGLIPFAGNALPFMSAGGSSLVTSLAAMGIVIGVSRISEKENREQATRYSDVIDYQNRRKERSNRQKTVPSKSKSVVGYDPKPVNRQMAKRNNRSWRNKRKKRE